MINFFIFIDVAEVVEEVVEEVKPEVVVDAGGLFGDDSSSDDDEDDSDDSDDSWSSYSRLKYKFI